MYAKLAVTLIFFAVAALLVTAAILIRRRRARGANVGKRKGQKGADAGGRATPKQIGMIRHLCKELGLNLRQTCRKEMNCWPDQLTKRTASEFIELLKGMASGDAADRPAQARTQTPSQAASGDRMTPKQFGMIRGLCRELRLDPVEHVQGILEKHPDDLTKREASGIIDGLKQMQGLGEAAHAG